MNRQTINIDPSTRWFNVMLLLAVNLNQAIKCCAIIDAYDEKAKIDTQLRKNDLFKEMIDCTYRDLLMSICRIYDEIDKNPCNINEIKKHIKNEPNYIFSEEEKKTIFSLFRPLQKEYKQTYKIDRDKRLAHTDYYNIYIFKNNKYSYEQIKEFVNKTKDVFNYILSINKDSIQFYDIDDLKKQYISLF